MQQPVAQKVTSFLKDELPMQIANLRVSVHWVERATIDSAGEKQPGGLAQIDNHLAQLEGAVSDIAALLEEPKKGEVVPLVLGAGQKIPTTKHNEPIAAQGLEPEDPSKDEKPIEPGISVENVVVDAPTVSTTLALSEGPADANEDDTPEITEPGQTEVTEEKETDRFQGPLPSSTALMLERLSAALGGAGSHDTKSPLEAPDRQGRMPGTFASDASGSARRGEDETQTEKDTRPVPAVALELHDQIGGRPGPVEPDSGQSDAADRLLAMLRSAKRDAALRLPDAD
ncbi:MAG: hypothetical protein AAF667_17810 [Pseudomonadota bacterium]